MTVRHILLQSKGGSMSTYLTLQSDRTWKDEADSSYVLAGREGGGWRVEVWGGGGGGGV